MPPVHNLIHTLKRIEYADERTTPFDKDERIQDQHRWKGKRMLLLTLVVAAL